MKQLSLILFFLTNIHLLLAQGTISKIIFDKTTNKPIVFAHCSIQNDSLQKGTVSNEDGRFVLQSIKDKDTLKISHIAYKTYINKILDITSDTIFLLPKIRKLKDITVVALSPSALMEQVIDSLKKNHFVEPVMYKMYGRIILYNKEKAKLHLLSEQIADVYYKKSGKHPFAKIKLRAKPFSKTGKKYIESMYMMENTFLFSNPAFLFSDNPVFNKRKLKKNYKIDILGEYNDGQYDLIKLRCSSQTEKHYKSVVLAIEKNSFAIKNIEIQYNKLTEHVGFIKNGNKWYIKTYAGKIMYNSEKYKVADNTITEEFFAIFNISNEKFDSSFLPEHAFIAKKVQEFVGDWSDKFWENYNFIPLPNWLKQKIQNHEVQ